MKSILLALLSCLLLTSGTLPSIAHISKDKIDEAQDKEYFKPSENVMDDITAMLAQSKAAGKLGMVIMGADWCHDSKAFVERLHSAEMKPVLESHYNYILVDVGPLDKGKDVINRFGMPVIYGTPTVLVIDPNSERQLNRATMHQWRDAYSISPEDTTAHFKAIAAEHRVSVTSPGRLAPAHRAALNAIDNFEQTQSERIYKAFDLIGPMIVMKREERPENFADLWNELRDFRYQITEDLKVMRASVNEQARAGETKPTANFPDYPAFSWEK